MKSMNEMLAADVNNYLYDLDPYEYIDDNGSLDDGYDRCLTDIENGETGGIIATLDEYDEDPAAHGLISRLRRYAE